jgi:hypothetical protein
MSTRESLIEAIANQPEPLLREVQHYLDFLVARQREPEIAGADRPTQWPEGYFEQTAGAFANERFERPPHLALEKRDEW